LGFIQIIKESKNQYSATVIEICYSKNAPAKASALDTALQRHCPSKGTSIAPIDKQSNNETNKHIAVNPIQLKVPSFEEFEKYCEENGFKSIANQAYHGYAENNWHDSKNTPVKNWKIKLRFVWFKEGNKDKPTSSTQTRKFVS
jgi:hypothetical protein